MENLSGIYCIKNIVNGKIYIGSSINCYKRNNSHFSELKNNKHKNRYLQKDYNKQQGKYFIFGIVELVKEKTNLINREQFYINTKNPEYNINLIANSSLGVKRSKETKEKIRQANLGLKHPEWRNKIKSEAQGGSNHWTKGKKFSKESKEKMSKTHKTLYRNGYINPRKDIKISKKQKELHKLLTSIPVNQYDLNTNFIKNWNSAKEASLKGFNASCISKCCKNQRKTHKKFIWTYKEK